jgi:hypothetical protein
MLHLWLFVLLHLGWLVENLCTLVASFRSFGCPLSSFDMLVAVVVMVNKAYWSAIVGGIGIVLPELRIYKTAPLYSAFSSTHVPLQM